MSGKSKLKSEIFRRSPFSGAITYVAQDLCPSGRSSWPYGESPGPTIPTIFEDASVRFAGGPPRGSTWTGLQLYQAFTRPVDEGFFNCGSRTYILSFDKRGHVPSNKAATQGRRASALAAQADAKGIPPWSWDPRVPVITMAGEIPPWSRIRLNQEARDAALSDLVSMFRDHYTPAPGCRLIVDWARDADRDPIIYPLVIETSDDGRHDRSVCVGDPRFGNGCGEADLCAQWYANLAGSPGSPIAGAIMIRTVDTDYLPLSIMHAAIRGPGAPIFLGLNPVHRASGSICTRTTAGAQPFHEVFLISELVKSCTGILDSMSLVVFCMAVGNDYISKPPGLSHKVFWAAYRARSRSLVRVTEQGRIIPDPDALESWLHGCYCEKLGSVPTSVGHDEVRRRVAARFRRTPPMDQDQRQTWIRGISWCFDYCSMGLLPTLKDVPEGGGGGGGGGGGPGGPPAYSSDSDF